MILIIDDDSAVRSSLSFMLKRAGYEAQTVSGPREAMEVVRSVAPDLILMDVRMPGLDGLSAAGIIRELNPTIPIIATTAFAFETDREMALAAGCNEYMSKPLEAEKLKTMIERCLENKL